MLETTILAVLQGVTEFLPVSSSGHLVIAQQLLGVDAPGMRLDVFLHLGTLLAIFAYFRKKIAQLASGAFSRDTHVRKEAWWYLAKLLLSALPAVVVYCAFKSEILALFENARMVGALLMFTGAVLVGTRYLPRGQEDVSLARALIMGTAQALALLPGVSRSGMTLVAARGGLVNAEKAAEFSFLMSAPIILGASLLEVVNSLNASPALNALEPSWALTLYGAALAAVVGYFSLVLLVKSLKGKRFWLFGAYCFVAGLATLVFVD